MKKQIEGRMNFIYDGKASKYSQRDLQNVLPFHGAMAALLRVVLDDVLDAAHASGNPTRYVSALISRRVKFDGKLENAETVDS